MHCRAGRTKEVKMVQGAHTDFFTAEQQRGSDAHCRLLTPRPLFQSLAAPWHRPSASPVTSPKRVRADVLTSTASTSKLAHCIRGSSSSTPRTPCPRGHARVCEEAPAWQPQLRATRRASEEVATAATGHATGAGVGTKRREDSGFTGTV